MTTKTLLTGMRPTLVKTAGWDAMAEALEIRQIPYWEVKALWPTVGPMLDKCIQRQDEWSLQGIYDRLTNAPLDQYPMQLWHVPGKGAVVTQINVFPMTGVRKLLIFMAGGEDADACLDLHEVISAWAVEYYKLVPGKDKIIVHGRWGWKKKLEAKGFHLKTICLEKVI